MITVVGECFDPLGHSWNAFRKTQTSELRSRQEDLIPLTLDHTELAGRVLTLTRIRGGSVYAVAVGDDRCDPLLDLDQPVFFSPTTNTRAVDGTDGIILDLALTLDTARVAAHPVTVLAGDVRQHNDRARWSLQGLTAELVDRAADEMRCRPSGGCIHIVDLETQKWMQRENERRSQPPAPLTRPRQQPNHRTPPQSRPGWQPGMIEWAEPTGRVVNVR